MYTDENCIRAICYDETVYPDPHTYDPTRFLDKDGKLDPSVKDPEVRVFGSGRRYECSRSDGQPLSSPTGFVPGVISRSGCCISLWRVFLPRSISSPQSTMPVVRRFRKLGTRRAWFGKSTTAKVKCGLYKLSP